MDNAREHISADNDYSTDGSTVDSASSHDSSDSESSLEEQEDLTSGTENFDQMEMMEIEMTFSGGRQDNIVVLWGDDPTDLARVSTDMTEA